MSLIESNNEESFTRFVEINGAWVLSFSAVLSACVSGTFIYFLKSRCSRIKCFCIECNRDVVSEDRLQFPVVNNV